MLIRIGALWAKEKEGKKFLSGEMEILGVKIPILVYKNEKREGNQPLMTIHVPMPDKEGREKPAPKAEEDYGF